MFVREVPNGKLYMGGAENNTFYIVHLWGRCEDNILVTLANFISPYELGYAQGQLLSVVELRYVANLYRKN